MKEELMNLETDFANNEYFGTNVWTDEKYRVLSGSVPVLLSAPHSVNQLRVDDVRDAEKYTGALLRYLCSSTNSYALEIFNSLKVFTIYTVLLFSLYLLRIFNSFNAP